MPLTRKISLAIGLALFFYLNTCLAHTVDLLQAFNAGLKNDPIFQEALATYLESKEATPESRAALLPQVRANFGVGKELQEFLPGGALGRFDTHEIGVNLSQTLFNWAAFKQLHASQASVKQAAYILSAAEQDLMIRVATAYFRVLEAQDIQYFTGVRMRSIKHQIAVVKERLKVGHSTITEYDQIHGSYDLIHAQYIFETNQIFNARQNLRQIIGPFTKLAKLKIPVPLLAPNPKKMSAWVKQSMRQNLSVQAASYGTEAAAEEMRVARGNRFPTVNLIGRYTDIKEPTSIANVELRRQNTFIGVNVNVPIFQGGLLLSEEHQALAKYQEQVAKLKQADFAAQTDTRKAYQGIISGIAEVQAGRLALRSNRSALKHTLAGYKVGTETVTDVLAQERRLFEAEAAYARDRIAYVLNTLRLQLAAGTLSPNSLAKVNRWLHTTHTSKKRHKSINAITKPRRTKYKKKPLVNIPPPPRYPK